MQPNCPGSHRIPQHYRAEGYCPPENPEGQCRSCEQWLPVAWHGQDPERGFRTVAAHEVRR
jgi:hypothetical protein